MFISCRLIIVPLVLFVTLSCRVFAQSTDGYVGLYFDANATQPCDSIPPLTAKTIYVVANVDGATSSGITGAEFRVEVTNPSGWIISYVPPPAANVALGNPIDIDPSSLDGYGVVVVFPDCQMPSNGKIPLGTISVFNISGTATNLHVKRHSNPTNQTVQCALFLLCDEPIFSKSCMSVGTEPPCLIEKTTRTQFNDPIISTASVNSAGSTSGPQATFSETNSFAGSLPIRDPWSPVYSRLVFLGADGGLYAYDAAQGGQPLLLSPEGSREVSWAPDGEWIAWRVRSGTNLRKGLGKLMVTECSGQPSPITLIERGDVGHFTWASNGNIYYWQTLSNRRYTLLPPQIWNPTNQTFPTRPFLVLLGSSRTELCIFNPTPLEQELVLTGLLSSTIHAALPEDTFPDLEKHLVSVYDNQRGVYTLITDKNGQPLVDLGDHSGVVGFAGRSVSPDGLYVIGDDVVSDGNTTVSARVYLAEAGGSWKLPVASITSGMNPCYASTGNIIAFEDPFTGVIHVGTLEVTY